MLKIWLGLRLRLGLGLRDSVRIVLGLWFKEDSKKKKSDLEILQCRKLMGCGS